MRSRSTIRTQRPEAGIALLISIFILLLISVVALALIVSSGTESALAGNYRSSTSVYYDALAGIEEGRGRLAGKGPSGFKTTDPTFLPAPLPMGNTYYLINPVQGEAITPWNAASAYPDKQFFAEYGVSPTSPSLTALSIWNKPALNPGNYPGPLYKWVRINAVSEQSLNVDADNDRLANANVPLYYDYFTNPNRPSFSNAVIPGYQVLELTAYAILPNGSQKILQYIVVPTPVPLPPINAALTLSGSKGNSYTAAPFFQAPANNAVYAVKGNDTLQGCSGTAGGPVAAIGLFGDYSGYDYKPDLAGIVSGIATSAGGPPPVNTQPNYTGQNSAPDVEYLYAGQTPAQLDALVQTITQNADVVITPTPSGSPPYLGTATGSALTPLGMSPSNPLTVVINGNLDVTSWTATGYGLLLVTGTFTYDPATTWDGIVFVIGQGVINNREHGLYMQINGAMFVAKTRDGNGNLLTGRIGGANVSFDALMQGNGVYYSSCWIKKATPTGAYKILSFHEIAQ